MHLLRKTAENVLSICLLTLLISVALLVITGFAPIPGGIRLFTVDTGSMTPAIEPGSVIVVKVDTNLKPGDVITFEHTAFKKDYITHRIVGVADTKITTKGDANAIEDIQPVAKSQVLGKVVLVIPFLGNFLLFILTKVGLLFCVIIPSLLIIAGEIYRIHRQQIAGSYVAPAAQPQKSRSLFTLGQVIFLIVCFSLIGLVVGLAIRIPKSASADSSKPNIVGTTLEIIKHGAVDLLPRFEPITPLIESSDTPSKP